MAVARKKLPDEAVTVEAPARPRPRGVKAGDSYADSHNPIAEQLIRLESALSAEPGDELPRYPGKVRLAILLGAPTALWVLIALAAMGVKALL